MKDLSTFQIIVIGLCVVFVMLGVGVFAAFGGLLGGSSIGQVVMWGTADQSVMDPVLVTLRSQDRSFEGVLYVQKKPATYTQDLLAAMAAGTGPDIFLIAHEDISSFADKITPIPYSAYSQSQFTGSFIDEGELFLTPQGALALPVSVDPLVMYWNRDLFAAVGLANPPKYWNDLLTIAPKITSIDQGSNVKKSAVALGVWKNIANAKEILSTLFMQAGDGLVARNSAGYPVAVFGQKPQGAPENPAESALRFYTEFANPSKTTYSWNSSLQEAGEAFVSGDVAMYFGFASEYQSIAARNPNLHFSAAVVPQLQGNTTRLTFGRMQGVALSKSARNPQGGATIMQKFTGQRGISLLVQGLGLPPVRRDVLLDTSNNAAASVFVQSSLIARGWLDPNPTRTDTMFQTMIGDVLSGAQLPAGAVANASQALSQLIPLPTQ